VKALNQEGTVVFVRSVEDGIFQKNDSLAEYTQVVGLESKMLENGRMVVRFGIKNLTGGSVPAAKLSVKVMAGFYDIPYEKAEVDGRSPMWRAFPRLIQIEASNTEYIEIQCEAKSARGFLVELWEE
jgi:hypothetical protein